MLISTDIETACNVSGCKGYNTSRKCDHALSHKHNKITKIAAYWEIAGMEHFRVFNSVEEFKQFIKQLPPNARLLGHNFGFDLKVLNEHGAEIPLELWSDDTMSMAVAYSHKIEKQWLEDYELRRKIKNKQAKAAIHREAGQYSLKTLAPYFAGTEAFWETEHHDDEGYVVKDVKYTYKLHGALLVGLKQDGTYDFYRNKLMPWSKFLLQVEQRGISIDTDLLAKKEEATKVEILEIERRLHETWTPAYKEYFRRERKEIYKEYLEKYSPQIRVAETDKKRQTIINRALKSLRSRIRKLPTRMNLNSPDQLKWIFKEYFGLNIRLDVPKVSKKTQKITTEGVDAAVVERLIDQNPERQDLKLFSQYRETEKLLTSFFESYKEMMVDGQLFCGFNLSGTRTGRLSSSRPNLQQVPGSLHEIFKARPGKLLATFDESSVEPRLIGFFSEDKLLYEIFANNEDFHGYATIAVFEHINCPSREVKAKFKKERELAKEFDLSVFYGAGANRIRISASKRGVHWTEDECRHKLRRFRQKFEQAFRFKNEELDPILMDGAVTNILGRKIRIEDPEEIYMKGFNTLIQSSASDLVLNSGYLIDEEFKKRGIDGGVLLLVHDELVIEIPEDREEECRAIIVEKMTNYKLETIHGHIPLMVEGKIARSWEK